MADDPTPTPTIEDQMAEISLAADLVPEEAAREIARATKGRRGVARRYVRWVRRRNPDATPAEVITMLERQYVTAISVAGAAITVGTVALEVGISLIPLGSAAANTGKAAAKKAGKEATKAATKETLKVAGKQAAASVALTGAQKVVALVPAGDEQLQFEITALFALALADIHGLELDEQQAHTLVYGLSNGRVSQEQIATMASDLAASKSDAGLVGVGQTIAGGREDWSHWATTLADSLPAGEAQALVRGVQTGVLEDVRTGLDDKQQAAVEYGVGALVGGVTRFVFGREVVDAARSAFAAPPADFPEHLAIPPKAESETDDGGRALDALQDAARRLRSGVGSRAAAAGIGAAAAAGAATRPFRSVDLDGDGIPDAPRALTAAKGVATAAGGVTRPFRRVDLDGDGIPDEARAVTAAKGVGKAVASPFKAMGRGRGAADDATGEVATETTETELEAD